jgi:glycosyltransferase involved in cell wall biosynthesis
VRVLIISQYFWPESFRINDLALGLKERGHEVTVLTGMPNYPSGRFAPGYGWFSPSEEAFEGIPVYRVPLVPRGKERRWQLALNYISFALLACLFGPFRCRGDYDAIFVYEPSPVTVGLPALVLGRLKRAPILFWVQDMWPESLSATGAVTSTFLLRWVGKLVRFIYRRCAYVLVQSEGFIPHVTATGADPLRVKYFPNWAEDFYRPVRAPDDAPERGEMPEGFRVMFAGNIGAAQSFETLLAAAEHLRSYPDIQWIILGDGHQKTWVEEQIIRRNLKNQVHLLGRRPVESMPRYFALADALLVSLRKDPLFAVTIPSKVQSYLACGRPVIAALEGTGAAVVQAAGAGVVCEPGDSHGLAEAVLTLSRLPSQERDQMGQRARAYYKRQFERSMLLDRLETMLQECARNPNRSRGLPCAS